MGASLVVRRRDFARVQPVDKPGARYDLRVRSKKCEEKQAYKFAAGALPSDRDVSARPRALSELWIVYAVGPNAACLGACYSNEAGSSKFAHTLTRFTD